LQLLDDSVHLLAEGQPISNRLVEPLADAGGPWVGRFGLGKIGLLDVKGGEFLAGQTLRFDPPFLPATLISFVSFPLFAPILTSFSTRFSLFPFLVCPVSQQVGQPALVSHSVASITD
jgi:hypothetical protein